MCTCKEHQQQYINLRMKEQNSKQVHSGLTKETKHTDMSILQVGPERVNYLSREKY